MPRRKKTPDDQAPHSTTPRTPEELISKYKWKKVETPRPWIPAEGEKIAGYYCGTTLKVGVNGQYHVAMIAVPGRGVVTISGVVIIQTLHGALMGLGTPVHITYLGLRETAQGHKMKDFDVMVPDGPPLESDEIPRFD